MADISDTKVDLKNTRLEGETIVLDNTSKYSHALGPDLELINCTIESDTVDRGLIVAGLKMTGGLWRQTRKLDGRQFDRAHFDRVRFEGLFESVTFGCRDDPERASIRNCDFSRAELTFARFLHASLDGMTLPSWPYFVVADGHGSLSAIRSLDWPGDIGDELNFLVGSGPHISFAVADARDIATQGDCTADQLRPLLERLPGIRITEPA